MDILPIRKLYIRVLLINVSGATLPKPKGTTGATKMKIMAIICYNADCGLNSYGYNIWQTLKTHFYTYLNDGDVRNVYHHLKDLCALDLLEREEAFGPGSTKRCLYNMTEKGRSLKNRYERYLEIVHRTAGSS